MVSSGCLSTSGSPVKDKRLVCASNGIAGRKPGLQALYLGELVTWHICSVFCKGQLSLEQYFQLYKS